MENTFWEVGLVTLCKQGETICGDFYEVLREDGRHLTAVLSDGLGSGIKANILSTMTAHMALRFIASDTDLVSAVQTMMDALPVCRIR